MPRLIPEQPAFTTDSEREVWERLRDHLGPDDVLMANLRLTDEDKDHEADLVVLFPDRGVLVLEVKGGSVWFEDGAWRQQRAGRAVQIDPVEQARAAKYALRTFVARDPRWGSRNHVAWGHAVVFPFSEVDADFETPDCPRWALHDRGDQPELAGRLTEHAPKHWQGKQPPTGDEVDLIADILGGRRVSGGYDVEAEAAENAAVADRLTREQADILAVTRLVPRLEVRGGAGSGKTILALEQAKQLSKGVRGRRPQRVALLCYSLGLAEFLKREVAGWPRRARPAFVGTFHDFGRQWGAPDGSREDSDFWEKTLPSLMGDLAEELDDGHRYDAIIVDEAQDFADDWWRPVLKSLRDEEQGGLFVYSDENQRIFARFGRPPVALVPLVLDHNLRNTTQIHDSFGPLAPSRMYAGGGHGPEVRFVPCDPDEAEATADDEVDRLLDAGWHASSIALLTTGHRHPIQIERTQHHDQDGYWRTFFEDDDVFYGHVLGCKGLERRAVVLCLNESEPRERSRERLYVGMSRATDQLVVVGSPGYVREVGGDEVAKRLGAATGGHL